MRDLLIEPDAEKDLAEAIAYYDSEQPGLGLEFLSKAKTLFLRIAATPRIYSTFLHNSRKAVMPRFPYVVLYFFNDETVFIAGVIHGKRKSRTMSTRVRRKRKR